MVDVMTKEYELPVLKCKRCLHSWIPRNARKPKVCPICKRLDWDGEQ